MEIQINEGTVKYWSGMRLEQFMSANSLTNFVLAKEAMKEARQVLMVAIVQDNANNEGDIVRANVRARLTREGKFEVDHTLTKRAPAIAGNKLHESAINMFVAKQAERQQLTERHANAFRALCQAKHEIAQRKAVANAAMPKEEN